MSKKYKRSTTGEAKILKIMSKKVKKVSSDHYKIKCEDKKERKTIKNACLHHLNNKDGTKQKLTLSRDGDLLHCNICHHNFRATAYKNEEVNDIIGEVTELTDQAKYLAVAVGLPADSCDFLSEYAVNTAKFRKMYTKITELAFRKREIEYKKKKNKKGPSKGGYQTFGSWSNN